MQQTTYEDSGVDIKKGEKFVSYIKDRVGKRYSENVVSGVGGFSSLYRVAPEKYLSVGTDGVGTKLKVATTLGIHNTIGIDLVAMNVNDIICSGATPSFFMDYLAYSNLEDNVTKDIIEGICKGCDESMMALIGGETAQMPDMYNFGDYDLAGFAVGEVAPGNVIDGSKICEGDCIIGLASSGVHSNGYSLLRKLIDSSERDILLDALTPTKIYVKTVHELMSSCFTNIHGIAHITGGGFTNVSRLNSKMNYHLSPPKLDEIPAIFTTLASRSKLSTRELYRTFNMGVGMMLVVDDFSVVSEVLRKISVEHWKVGEVVRGDGNVFVNDVSLA